MGYASRCKPVSPLVGTMRNQILALLLVHIINNSQHARASWTWGILSNSSACSLLHHACNYGDCLNAFRDHSTSVGICARTGTGCCRRRRSTTIEQVRRDRRLAARWECCECYTCTKTSLRTRLGLRLVEATLRASRPCCSTFQSFEEVVVGNQLIGNFRMQVTDEREAVDPNSTSGLIFSPSRQISNLHPPRRRAWMPRPTPFPPDTTTLFGVHQSTWKSGWSLSGYWETLSSHSFDCVVSKSVTSAGAGALTLGCRHISQSSSVPASSRFLSPPSVASPSVSLAESCDLPSPE